MVRGPSSVVRRPSSEFIILPPSPIIDCPSSIVHFVSLSHLPCFRMYTYSVYIQSSIFHLPFSTSYHQLSVFHLSYFTCRIQSPDIPLAGRGGPRHSGVGRQGGSGRDGGKLSRGLISIFGPIFDVEDQLLALVGGVARRRRSGSSPFRPGRRKAEGPSLLGSVKPKKPPYFEEDPIFEKVSLSRPSSVRSSDLSSGPKIEEGGSSFVVLQLRSLKIEDNRFFVRRLRSNVKRVLRSSGPNIEDRGILRRESSSSKRVRRSFENRGVPRTEWSSSKRRVCSKMKSYSKKGEVLGSPAPKNEEFSHPSIFRAKIASKMAIGPAQG